MNKNSFRLVALGIVFLGLAFKSIKGIIVSLNSGDVIRALLYFTVMILLLIGIFQSLKKLKPQIEEK